MAWLVGIVVLLLLVFSTGFRKVAGVLVALVAVIVGIFVVTQRESERQARALIPASVVDLREVRLQPDSFGAYKLVGRIKNNSPSYTLTGLSLKIVLEDCEGGDTSQPSCVTIGESEEHPLFENIPAGQVRDVSDYIFPGSTKPQGKLVWHYSISYTEGK
jgi:hypothetical protein